MAFTHTYGKYAALSSFNKYLQDNLGASLPSWMDALKLNFDYPREPLTFPSFSVTHFGAEEERVAGSDVVDPGYYGVRIRQVSEVSCWADANADPAWQGHLWQMRDMVWKVLRTAKITGIMALLDVYAGTESPAESGGILRIERIADQDTTPEANLNVKRLRIIVTSTWIERRAM